MRRDVVPSPAAARDLAEARAWLLQPGAGTVAREKLLRIRTAIRQLRTTPCRWPVGNHIGVREIPVAGYRILYRVTPDTGEDATAGTVRLLRVFGPHQLRDHP